MSSVKGWNLQLLIGLKFQIFLMALSLQDFVFEG